MYVSYKTSLQWIVNNDDTSEIDADDANISLTVCMALVADMFNKTDEQIINDIRKLLKRKRNDKIN